MADGKWLHDGKPVKPGTHIDPALCSGCVWHPASEKKPGKHDLAVQFLESCGIEPTSSMMTQFNVLVEALFIHETRKSYGDIWRKYGALSNLLSVARKADRLMQIFWHGSGELTHKDSVDDAYDLINYAAFFIRNVTDGNMKGTA